MSHSANSGTRAAIRSASLFCGLLVPVRSYTHPKHVPYHTTMPALRRIYGFKHDRMTTGKSYCVPAEHYNNLLYLGPTCEVPVLWGSNKATRSQKERYIRDDYHEALFPAASCAFCTRRHNIMKTSDLWACSLEFTALRYLV